MSASRRDAIALSAAAFALGLTRAWSSPVVSDANFRLLRVGRSLLAASLDAYAIPPGGDGAPPVAALLTGLVSFLPIGIETSLRLPGTIALACSAALVTWALARCAGALVAGLGASLLLLPPLFATAFVARPDAALAGTAIFAALVVRWNAPPFLRPVPLATWAALASPFGIPALAVACARERERRRAWFVPLVAVAIVVLLSLALPEGRRGEIIRALVGADSLFGSPSAVFAALSPLTAFGAALFVARIPDSASESRASRPVVVAFLVPLLLFVATAASDRRARGDARASASRLAQIGRFLEKQLPDGAMIAAAHPGALAFYSNRPVVRLAAAALDTTRAPQASEPVVCLFDRALFADTPDERALFDDGAFVTRYAPVVFRRGEQLELQDAIWRRRLNVTSPGAPREYLDALRLGWELHAANDIPAAAGAFATAAAVEPEGLGIAHEWWGMLEDDAGHGTIAEPALEIAVRRDSATARARGHLADRALSRGDLARADTLLAQSLQWNHRDPEAWGTLARLAAIRGDLEIAREAATRAIGENPLDGRLLVNLGSILWKTGERGDAKELWRRAVRQEPRLARYLGNFEKADSSSPAPPLLPLFTLASFEPGTRRPTKEAGPRGPASP